MDDSTANNIANEIITGGFISDFHVLMQMISTAITKYESALQSLEEILAEIQTHSKNVKIARGVGAGVGAAAAPFVVGGLVLAPFTGGLSLVAALSTAGVAGAVIGAGTLTNGVSAVVGAELSAGLVNKASKIIDECKIAEENVRTLYRLFDSKCTALLEGFPHIKEQFSVRENSWVFAICIGCMAGLKAIAAYTGISAGYSTFLSTSCGVGFHAGLVPGIKATIATAIQECTSVVVAVHGAVTSSSVALAGFYVFTFVIVSATFIFNIYTLVKLFDKSPSKAEEEVSTAISDLKKRKDGMDSLLKELKVQSNLKMKKV